MSTYPEHEKMKAVAEHSQEIGRFLDEFLPGEGITLAVVDGDDWMPVRESITSLLAKFYDIDLTKIEKEKQQMLDEIRAGA